MRTIIFSILMVLGFGANAQSIVTGYVTDTLANAETIYLYVGSTQSVTGAARLSEYGVLSTALVSDSLSGSTAVTATIEYAIDDAGSYWYTHATLTALNGATSQVQVTEDAVFAARKARIKLVGAGTQSTRVRLYYCFKEAN